MEEEKRKKKTREEALEGGRLLGVIARQDPELYATISEIAQLEGTSPMDVTVTFLKKYILSKKVTESNLNMEQILTAFEIFKEMAREIIRMYTTMSTLFFSEMTTAYAELINQRVEERLKYMQQSKPVDEQFKNRMMNMMLSVLEPMMMHTIRQAFKASGAPIPETLKANIPVEIKIKSSEENGGSTPS